MNAAPRTHCRTEQTARARALSATLSWSLTQMQQTAAKPEEEVAEEEDDIPEETTYGLGMNSA